jgi:cathepsin B
MFRLITVGTVMAFAVAHIHPVNQDIIDEIRAKATTWVPMELEENPLHHMSFDQVAGLLGTINDFTERMFPEPEVSNAAAPTSFDSRTQWPNCVHAIRDQASCGSCWAFGSSEAMSDRVCIAGGENVVLSPQDLVSCDTRDSGCDGGYLNRAWSYIESTGIVSDACMPYTSSRGTVASCPSKCTGSGTWKKYKCKSGTVVQASTVAAIQSEIQARGPMETGFDVYADFMNYASGIYQHKTGKYEGGHAVKIVGWGVEGSVKYWICANSWGTSWGEKGFFRIKMGDCNIDQAVYGCTASATNDIEFF